MKFALSLRALLMPVFLSNWNGFVGCLQSCGPSQQCPHGALRCPDFYYRFTSLPLSLLADITLSGRNDCV